MFFQLLYIHLFRPFLKYNPNNSPLPAHVSPRKLCTSAAQSISKLLRLYKRSHGLRQICNIAVYIAHSACTIHLLNLPEKNAKRDIIHGVKHLEEIAEGWLCARRTLGILSILAKKWNVELPEEAATVLARTDAKFGPYNEVTSPKTAARDPEAVPEQIAAITEPALPAYSMPLPTASATNFFDNNQRVPLSSLSGAAMQHRGSEARSLPPNDASSLAYPRAQRDNPATPASTTTGPPGTRQSFDANASSTGNSPSQFFGGVEQLIREGQDWWLRDQNQLAIGFDNWTMPGSEEMGVWLNNTAAQAGAISSPPMGPTSGYATSPMTDANGAMNGGPVNGTSNVNGMNGVTGLNAGGYGTALNSYNEQDWYQ
jgi:hypothetical protein